MRRNRLSIMGVSDVRWKDGDDFVRDGYRVMYAGGSTCQRGVAVIAEAKVAERVTEIDRFGDRIMAVKVKADPVDMVIIQELFVQSHRLYMDETFKIVPELFYQLYTVQALINGDVIPCLYI